LTGREPEKRIQHRERCTLASRIQYINEFKNTDVVESWLIVYFKKEKHGELGGS
jgi:hypothetical protein